MKKLYLYTLANEHIHRVPWWNDNIILNNNIIKYSMLTEFSTIVRIIDSINITLHVALHSNIKYKKL